MESPTLHLYNIIQDSLVSARSLSLGEPPSDKEAEKLDELINDDIALIFERSNVGIINYKEKTKTLELEIDSETSIWERRKLLENTFKRCLEILSTAQPIKSEFASGVYMDDDEDFCDGIN